MGWNIPESLRSVTVQPTGDVAEIGDAQLANVATLSVEPHETLVESEPNDREGPQQMTLPATVSGRIENEADVDAYAFEARQGEVLVFELESRALGYPLDGVLEVLDAAGKSLSRVDDAGGGRDAAITFTSPADGTYRLVVTDLNRAGSSRHVYRVRAVPATPAFNATVDAHAYTVAPDQPAAIAITIDRQHGFAEPVEFTVAGLPDFVTAAPTKSEPTGDSAKSLKLSLTTTGGAFSGPIRVRAQATGTSQLERTATAAIPNHAVRTSDLWLTVAAAKK